MPNRTGMLKPGLHCMGGEQQVADVFDFRGDLVEFFRDQPPLFLSHDKGNTAGTHQTFSEPVAAKNLQQVEKIAAHPAEIGRRRVEGDIAAQGPEVAEVIGYAFKLEGDGPHQPGTSIDLESGQGLEEPGSSRDCDRLPYLRRWPRR
jgi:hypothetical protein